MTEFSPFPVKVASVSTAAPNIKSFILQKPDGGALPGFTPGAHIQVCAETAAQPPTPAARWRSYSLMTLDVAAPFGAPVPQYQIAVREEEASRGGSRFMARDLHAGDTVYILPPSNDFPLSAETDGAVLIAGGIGVTPIATMAAALQQRGKRFSMHYASRSRNLMAFGPELAALLGDRLHLHFDDEPGSALKLPSLLAQHRPGDVIYCCGPKGMIDAVFAAARACGWPDAALRSELFEAASPRADDRAFEVELASSGKTLTVPADKTLLDVLLQAGAFVPNDCRAGACGLCGVPVISGEIDHRDDYLLDEDKAGGKIIQACVSRAKGARLVLDL